MRFIASRLRSAAWVLMLSAGLFGCTSPPSVVPLLSVAQKAIQDEARQVAADAAREQSSVSQSQASLKAGFDADLVSQAKLTAAWVKQETAGYVAAREALVEQAAELKQAQTQRIDNLNAAMSAQQRAIELLQQRDALIERMQPKQLSTLGSLIGINPTSQRSQ